MKKIIIAYLVIFGGVICMSDGIVAFLLNNPEMIPQRYIGIFKKYYKAYDRKLIHLLPESGRYDAYLSYTLKPGQWIQDNREYHVRYLVNSFGLRDDENSLVQPEVIVLGDSQAMGWGVEQTETFASLIEESSKRKVLNAAVVSYGSVREFMNLKRLDRSKLKYLILQYSQNDYLENRVYRENGNILPINPKDKYYQISKEHLRAVRYYPWKHSLGIGRLAIRGFLRLPQERKWKYIKYDVGIAVDDFLNVLLHVDMDLSSYQIFMVDASTSMFIPQLRHKIENGAYPQFIEEITILEPSYKKEDYFRLDGHLNSEGHRTVFESLSVASSAL